MIGHPNLSRRELLIGAAALLASRRLASGRPAPGNPAAGLPEGLAPELQRYLSDNLAMSQPEIDALAVQAGAAGQGG